MSVAVAGLGTLGQIQLQAQDQTGAASFPDPVRLAADFPDEVERYVALNLLWDMLHSMVPGAIAQRRAYYNAAETIRTKYMVMGDKPYQDFEDRNRKLTADSNFRGAVLKRYGLKLVSTPVPEKRPFFLRPAAHPGQPTDAEIKMAFLNASPFIAITFVLMTLVARFSVRRASRHSSVAPPSKAPPDLPELPESLRVVSLPVSQYSVDICHGLAFDKETTYQTHVQTSTTQGQVYSMGNQLYSTPGQTTTTVSTTQQDLVWIRTPDRRETSWTFTGGQFKVRPGQVLSAITPAADSVDSGTFLMAYNHNTGQFEHFGNGGAAVRSGSGWFLCSLLGSVGFGFAIVIILSIQSPDPYQNSPSDVFFRYLSMWIEGGIAAAIVAVFVVLRAKGRLMLQRNTRFRKHYVPAFHRFLEQATPQVMRHFGVAPSV